TSCPSTPTLPLHAALPFCHQRVDIGGSDGTIEIEIPFNPPIDRRCTIVVRRGDRVEPIALERANQYERQFAAFSCAVAADEPVRSEEHTSELQSPYDLVCR